MRTFKEIVEKPELNEADTIDFILLSFDHAIESVKNSKVRNWRFKINGKGLNKEQLLYELENKTETGYKYVSLMLSIAKSFPKTLQNK